MKLVLALTAALLFVSCSSWFHQERTPSSVSSDIFPKEEVKSVSGEMRDGSIHLKGESGFFKKIDMINNAPKGSTIKMAYFIFEDDYSSSYLSSQLINAAKKGVKVQLLIDYFMSEKYVPWLKFIAAQSKNISIRRFREPTEGFVNYLKTDLGMKDHESFIKGLMAQNSDLLLRGMMSSDQLRALIESQGKLVGEIKKLKEMGKINPNELNNLSLLVLQSLMTDPSSVKTVASLPKLRNFIVTFLRRMHHKIMITKNEAGESVFIVGGRNVSDEYHISADELNHDVNLLKGRSYPFFDSEVSGIFNSKDASSNLEKTFEKLWNSDLAVGLDEVKLSDSTSDEMLNKINQNEKMYLQNKKRMEDRATQSELSLNGVITVAYVENSHLPSKKEKQIHQAWKYLIENARESIDIVSAYLFLYDDLIEPLKKAASNGVKIRLYTNSASTTDLAIVNAGAYQKIPKWWEEIKGVEFYELGLQPGKGSLHAKIINVDNEFVGIGSCNTDPRNYLYDSNNFVIMDFHSDKGMAEKIFSYYIDNPGTLPWNKITQEGLEQVLNYMKNDDKSKTILKMTQIQDVINQL